MSVEDVYNQLCTDIRYYIAKNTGDMLYGDDEWWDSLDGMQ